MRLDLSQMLRADVCLFQMIASRNSFMFKIYFDENILDPPHIPDERFLNCEVNV